MAILAFQKPENVLMMDATDSYAKFEFRPLEPGYGTTVGNALRRILLSSLEATPSRPSRSKVSIMNLLLFRVSWRM